ncbi:alpha/beta hydrolase family protein [Flavisphingomonas formosensis]|uniref:hypothetical protein n=1 Tax=Flavisphingomonas formosensis TaxID=861534 RepID=UPI0012FB9BE9|nr:hypothetical protein [Sphingomonas formosensis]
MNPAEPRFASYAWRDTPQPMLAYGPADGPQLLVLQPLFAEMNRCRRLIGRTLRLLAADGVGCWMPDLPGCGESPAALASIDFRDWQDAVAAAAESVARGCGRRPLVAAFRGGALLDGIEAAAHWRLSPLAGRMVLRDLVRARLASDREEGTASTSAAIEAQAAEGEILLAGYRLAPGLSGAIAKAGLPSYAEALRTVRLEGDAAPADAYLPGPPLWRRAEPGDSPALAAAIAADISGWARAWAA